MPRIVSRYKRPEELIALGPMVYAEWSLPAVLVTALQQRGRPVPPAVGGCVLIDTGATSTCIDMDVASQLGLKQVGYQPTYGVHGLQQSPVFSAHCAVGVEDGDGPGFVETDLPVAGVKDLMASGAQRGLLQNDAPIHLLGILGRDFLVLGTLVYRGRDGARGDSTRPPGCVLPDRETGGVAAQVRALRTRAVCTWHGVAPSRLLK